MSRTVLFWRRTDLEGLERLELAIGPDGVVVQSSLICLEDEGFRLDHRWRLDADWRVQSVFVERWNARDQRTVRLERAAAGWRVDGSPRTDLDGAAEPDLSVTPFCNTIAIRKLWQTEQPGITLDVAYIDGSTLQVARSSQRYERRSPNRVRYIDLGLSRGFEADLVLDDKGLVLRYEHLFERVTGAGAA
jgi:uncharacterized protein